MNDNPYQLTYPAPVDPSAQQAPQAPQLQQPVIAAPQGPVAPPQLPLGASPQQAQSATLGNIQTSQNIAGAMGNNDSAELSQIASKDLEAGAQAAQHDSDYKSFLKQFGDQHAQDHQRAVDAYSNYQKQAGNLKDPSSQYWADKGVGSQVLGGLAAFASGMGAGLLGHAGNPYLDFLNNEMNRNFDAHKQNVKDLYDQQLAAGKIDDTDENYQAYMDKAKQTSYSLDSIHLMHEMQGIKDQSGSQRVKLAADQTINGLQQELTNRQSGYTQQQAAAAAAQLAMQRAQQKEVREAYAKQLDAHKDLGDDEARVAAAKDLQGMGYNRSVTGPILQSNGFTADPKTGDWVAPVAAPKDSDDLIPLKDDATGKLYKPEEREKMRQLVVTLPDGTQRLANNPQDKEHATNEIGANQKMQDFTNLLEDHTDDKGNVVPGYISKYKNGDLTAKEAGQWNTARQGAIDSFKGAASGSEGMTGKGTATMLGEEAFPEAPGFAARNSGGLGGGLYRDYDSKGASGQVEGLKKLTAENQKNVEARFRPAAKKKEDSKPAKTVSVKDLPSVK